jgi:hypothetical protein
MDLEINCGGISAKPIRGGYIRALTIEIEDVDKSVFDTKEIAECISIETFIDAIGEDIIKDHIQKYYDWFSELP